MGLLTATLTSALGMALMCRPHHWTATLVHFATQVPQHQLQLTARPTDPLNLLFGVPLEGPSTNAPAITRAPAPGLYWASEPGRTSPRGTAPSKGAAAPPAPSQQSIGPGLATRKSPRPSAPLSLKCRPGAPGSVHTAAASSRSSGSHRAPDAPSNPRRHGWAPLAGRPRVHKAN
ncbi:hypothetical protein NDU88_003255 [Pleurodeles waltl]|uniref:Secreted protein n=1 Tax=Pleurodeles waltl TaxID=8319 RepID=A0AAV7MR42_PLEWA|nr:hypothetical protein NDU88_003255 [Pleurodeles waltl]